MNGPFSNYLDDLLDDYAMNQYDYNHQLYRHHRKGKKPPPRQKATGGSSRWFAPRRKQFLRWAVDNPGTYSLAEMVQATGVSNGSCYRAVQKMIEWGEASDGGWSAEKNRIGKHIKLYTIHAK